MEETRKCLRRIWKAMLYRCNDKTNKNYGGRGIKVCFKWKNSFEEFYDWAINNGYKEGLTLDRENFNYNYTPNNCRWITIKEQQRNKRNNRFITYNGETHCVSKWIEITGIKKDTFFDRLNKNLPLDKVFYKGNLHKY